MSTLVTYTSTLPHSLMKWLDSTAKSGNTTKKQIIVDALLLYRQQFKREKLAETFKRASCDPEILAMAEEGLDDYINQLENL